MILKIKLLKQIGRFTELHCGHGESGNFAELNVIYAEQTLSIIHK